MHVVVMDSLEEYLSGTLEPATRREIEAHLSNCKACREEVRSMQEVSLCMSALRSDEVFEPSPGFYAAIRQRVGERKAATPSFASLFALDSGFRRWLVFASLVTLGVMGSILVSNETEYQVGPSPVAVMAEQDSPSFDAAPAPDNMLVTLTAYEQR